MNKSHPVLVLLIYLLTKQARYKVNQNSDVALGLPRLRHAPCTPDDEMESSVNSSTHLDLYIISHPF